MCNNKIKNALLAGAILAFSSTCVMAEEKDTYLHFGGSTALGSIAHQYFTQDKRELPYKTDEEKRYTFVKSVSLCSGIGLTKEIYDKTSGGKVSKKDLAYDLAGCFFGTSLSSSFNKIIVDTKFNFDESGDMVTMVNFNYHM